MSVWHIKGGNRLSGSVGVQGSKNAVLPIIAASLLSGCETELTNCPELSDVEAAVDILRHLGCSALRSGDRLEIDSRELSRCDIPRELMHRMRSSVIFLGPLLARCGEAHIFVPGGCELGKRPVDLHLHALRRLGAEVRQEGEEIICRAERLRGAEIYLRLPSVGATENAMIAACAAEGDSVIYNAAREPEIVTLQNYLRELGAAVYGAGTPVIRVTGFRPKAFAAVRIPSDRIVAATWLCCAACAGGELELRDVERESMELTLRALSDMGCVLHSTGSDLRITVTEPLRSPGAIVTRPYPGFPTDAAPLLMAACARSTGTAVFIENIFENRYRHAHELTKLGADIETRGSLALVRGVKSLYGGAVCSPDLRGGAALAAAALGAEGETLIYDSGHILRGYEHLDERLRSLGADIVVEDTDEKQERRAWMNKETRE
ncbi:MAG: UDP-N-acetylglucosamine 1-carboxyvinyltransferase [Ruminococcaceae bacterium]|nr:UDP-N-acetylglucosamine 1-carboxyvinyltransferase [Oscillospiraceae bacterium]